MCAYWLSVAILPASVTIPEAPKTRRGSRWIQLALVPLGVALVLGLAEAAVRIAGHVRGEPYSVAAMEREMKRILALMTASQTQGQAEDGAEPDERRGTTLHPYFGFDWAENAAQIGRDVEYFRSAECEPIYDVLIVGGSVAGSFGHSGSARLEELLAADPLFRERSVRIHAYGRAGYKQPQQCLLVAYFLGLGYRPDLVLNIDGFNESALANANLEQRVHPAHPSSSHWAHLASARRSDRTALDFLIDMRARQRKASEIIAWVRTWHLQESALLGGVVGARLRTLRKQYVAIAQRYVDYLTDEPDATVSGPPFPAEPEAARELVLRTWFESSRSLAALCRARSIHYLHVLQPTLHDEGSKPLTEAEVASGTCLPSWQEGVHFAYPRMRQLGLELRELGVHFADCSHVFEEVGEKLYHDPCHFSPRGNELLAEPIAATILGHARASR